VDGGTVVVVVVEVLVVVVEDVVVVELVVVVGTGGGFSDVSGFPCTRKAVHAESITTIETARTNRERIACRVRAVRA